MKRQKSILILDDDADIGEVLYEVLEPVYNEVIYSDSPAKAKELVTQRAFSLIICDVLMPELPGPEFVRLVRSLGRIEPVIFLTGNASKEMILSALRLGASDVLEKPFNGEELLRAIDRAFEIEKRRLALYESLISKQDGEARSASQRKMIGLLQAANLKK